MNTDTFINESLIVQLMERHPQPDAIRVRDVIHKALDKKGLDLEDAAVLLNDRNPETREQLYQAARRIKQEIYGKRLVLFAPFYIANICKNNCLYCGFRRDNRQMKRRVLTMDEIRSEILHLEEQGHKRILMLTGEDMEQSGMDYLLDAIRVVYETRTPDGKGEIRRVNVEVAPVSVDDFRRLKSAHIGTYVLFQETYHQAIYSRVHPDGPKADYRWRLYAMDRAQEAGIDDVGLGVLFGLYDYKFEVLAMLRHARHLDETFGVGPHTISVPRIEPAMNAPVAEHVPDPVSDEDFKRIVAILRLTVPYTGIILTTREKAGFRDDLFDVGVSQISAGSRTHPGGYSEGDANPQDEQQFSLGDTRSLDEVVRAVCERGYLPSFCTACYRMGRTGEDFMDLAKPGLINAFCLPNAILTFKEYLADYASPETRIIGDRVIHDQMGDIVDEASRLDTEQKVRQIEQGRRDLYF